VLPEDLAARLGLEGELPHLAEALTHPSFSNEQRRAQRVDNQRLEFLGDAVLGLCVTELLMTRFPRANEGELSLIRSTLVSTDALAGWARTVDLGTALRLGRGADLAREREQKNVLADAVEAVVGAVHLDLGLDAARTLVRAIVAEPLGRLETVPSVGRDPKSALQEHVQASGSPSPRYRVVDSHGPDHDREFLVAVEVAGELLAEGRGRSKKLAEQAAARAALEKLGLTATEPSEAPPDSENANAVRGEPAPVVSAPPEAGEPPASTKEEP
jgi:ribonuclease-3